MSELITVARPYAIAAFDFAIEHQSVDHWQKMLMFSSTVVRNEQIAKLLFNALAPKTLSDLFIAVCGNRLDKAGQNFIRVMAESRRLFLLPTVLQLYIQQRNAVEGISEINVISASTLTDEQLMRINTKMEKHLLRKVKLNCKIDKSIIAGVIIQVDDIVIDSSVRNRLDRLADVLQS